jgi:HrpA-like RNA helicase
MVDLHCEWQLKSLGIDNILGFDWPASPSPEAMIRALEILFSLGILDEDAKLTVPIGFQVAETPPGMSCCRVSILPPFSLVKLCPSYRYICAY